MQFIDNQYQHNSEVLEIVRLNKSCAFPLNVEPSNSVSLKTCDTEFYLTIIIYKNQNSRFLYKKGKVNLTLLISKLK